MPTPKVGKTEEECLKEFPHYCRYIALNDEEGYYTCQGFKSLDTRKLFVMWVNEFRGLDLKK